MRPKFITKIEQNPKRKPHFIPKKKRTENITYPDPIIRRDWQCKKYPILVLGWEIKNGLKWVWFLKIVKVDVFI